MGGNGQTLEDVRKLKKALFVDQPYDVKMRPIQNQSNQVVVSLTLCTLLDCPINIHTVRMGWSIIQIRVHMVNYSNNYVLQSQESVFNLANSAGPDEMPHFAAFHLSLHCVSKYPFMVFQYTKG